MTAPLVVLSDCANFLWIYLSFTVSMASRDFPKERAFGNKEIKRANDQNKPTFNFNADVRSVGLYSYSIL